MRRADNNGCSGTHFFSKGTQNIPFCLKEIKISQTLSSDTSRSLRRYVITIIGAIYEIRKIHKTSKISSTSRDMNSFSWVRRRWRVMAAEHDALIIKSLDC